jgi:hypothetical protein
MKSPTNEETPDGGKSENDKCRQSKLMQGQKKSAPTFWTTSSEIMDATTMEGFTRWKWVSRPSPPSLASKAGGN